MSNEDEAKAAQEIKTESQPMRVSLEGGDEFDSDSTDEWSVFEASQRLWFPCQTWCLQPGDLIRLDDGSEITVNQTYYIDVPEKVEEILEAQEITFGEIIEPQEMSERLPPEIREAMSIEAPPAIIPPAPIPVPERAAQIEAFGSIANAEQIRQSTARLMGYVAKLGDGTADIWDLAAAALAAEHIDPILQRIKYRQQMIGIMSRTSKTIELLTSLAASFKLELDGSPVEIDSDFSNWPEAKIRRLAVLIWSHAESVLRRHSEILALQQQLAEAGERYNLLAEKLKSQEAQTTVDTSTQDEAIATVKQAVQYANTQLALFIEQPMFVVARLDPLTKKPKRFFKVDEDVIKSQSSLIGCSRFGTYKEASVVRGEILRAIWRRQRVIDSGENNRIAVMQVNLREVTDDEMGDD